MLFMFKKDTEFGNYCFFLLRLLFHLLLEHFLWIFVSNPIPVDFYMYQSSQHRCLCSFKICVSKQVVEVTFFFHVEVASVHYKQSTLIIQSKCFSTSCINLNSPICWRYRDLLSYKRLSFS